MKNSKKVIAKKETENKSYGKFGKIAKEQKNIFANTFMNDTKKQWIARNLKEANVLLQVAKCGKTGELLANFVSGKVKSITVTKTNDINGSRSAKIVEIKGKRFEEQKVNYINAKGLAVKSSS